MQYGLFDTGVDVTGAALAEGATDSHYTLPINPTGAAGTVAVVGMDRPAADVADTATTSWIAPTADQSVATTTVPGDYEYQTTFTVPAGGGVGHFSGQLTADDTLTDVVIGDDDTRFTTDDLSTTATFAATATLAAGPTTIDFFVHNAGTTDNPSGLFVHDLTLDFSPAVAVDQPTTSVVYGGTASATGTFADPDTGDTVTLSSSQGTITPSGTNNGTFTLTDPGVTSPQTVTITATDSQGNVQTTALNVAVTAPTLAGGGNTVTALSGGPAVAIDPGLTLTDDGGPDLSAASVSIGTNFTPGEDQLLFTPQNGITGAYDATTGVLSLTGSATPAQYQAALQSVQYQDTDTDPVTASRSPRTIQFRLGSFGAVSSTPASTTVDVTSASDAPVVTGPTGPISTNAPAATITGTADAGSLVQVYDDGNDNGAIDPGETVVASEQLAAGATAYSIAAPLTANAANNFLVTATDAGAIASAPVVVPAITSDTIAPAAPVVSNPFFPVATNDPIYTDITGTAEAGSLVQVFLNDGTGQPTGASVAQDQLAAGQTAFELAVPLTANAATNFVVTATDAAGNVSAPSLVPTITSDTIPPAAPTITGPTGPISTNAPAATITGTAEAGSLVQVFLNDGTGHLITGTEVGMVRLAAGQTTFTLTVPLTANATNNFVVVAVDAADNDSANVVIPTITQQAATVPDPVMGTVYLDLNGDGMPETGEPGLADRVVFIGLDGSNVYQAGDPTTTTDSQGNFVFSQVTRSGDDVDVLPDQDATDRYAVVQNSSDLLTVNAPIDVGVVPYSPIFPVPVRLNPQVVAGTGDAFVRGLYRAVLGRDGTAAEVAGWATAMSQGATTGQVAARFVNSPEHRTEQVAAYYEEFLHRAPDPLAAGWVTELIDGASEQAVVEGILDSPEYQAATPDAATYVRDLSIDVLGRQAGDTEVADWVTALNSGTTRAMVVDDFVGSVEADDQLVTSFYVNDLRRQPETPAALNYWVDQLSSGTSVGAVAGAILDSPEFQQEAGSQTPPITVGAVSTDDATGA